MQLILTLIPRQELSLPTYNTYALQSAVYNKLREIGQSDFWHDRGYGEKSKYKGFCFGPLEGCYRYEPEKKLLRFSKPIRFELRSPVADFVETLVDALEKNPELTLLHQQLEVSEIATDTHSISKDICCLSAVTPVVYSTALPSKHTYYHNPEEKSYFEGLENNVRLKYQAITGKACGDLSISAVGTYKKIVTRYKEIWVTGYKGLFFVSAAPQMLDFIYDTGLGEKNAQGMGFLRDTDCREIENKGITVLA